MDDGETSIKIGMNGHSNARLAKETRAIYSMQ